MIEKKRRHSLAIVSYVALIAILSGFGCWDDGSIPPDTGSIPPDTGSIPPDTGSIPPDTGSIPPAPVRNVILFIGDGMGLQQISLLTQYRRVMNPDMPLTSFERLFKDHYVGINDVYMLDSLVVDSAAAATQMACGIMTISQVIGLDPMGAPCRTVLEEAFDLGKSTGLITDTRITHATPAAFVAKQVSSDLEPEIADDMINGVARDKVQIMLGGGGSNLIPASLRFSDIAGCEGIHSSVDGSSERADEQNLIADAQANGYRFACTHDDFDALPEDEGTKILGIFARSGFPYYPERATIRGIPSITAMTEKSISILEKNPNGFFLMVEAGQIDWGAHDNDGAYVLEAMKEADDALLYLMDYVEQNPDTLLIVTADHETGGMGFSYAQADDNTDELPFCDTHTASFDFPLAEESYHYLTQQTMSYAGMVDAIASNLYLDGFVPNPEYPIEQGVQDLITMVSEHTGHTLTEEQAMEVLYVDPDTGTVPHGYDRFYPHNPFRNRLSMQFVDDTHLVWATGTHTSTPVPIMAIGNPDYAQQVLGYGHSVNVGNIIFAALNNESSN